MTTHYINAPKGLPIRTWVQTENGVIFLEKIVNVIKNNSKEEERGGNENEMQDPVSKLWEINFGKDSLEAGWP